VFHRCVKIEHFDRCVLNNIVELLQ
jgi:hypothetical protein